GISLAIYEAMAMGVAVVGADVGGQRELVVPGSGVLIPRGPSEFDDYVQALKFLLQNPEQRRAIGRQARERIIRHFSLDRMIQQVLELLSEAKQRSHMASPSVDTSLAREIAIRAIESMRLDLSWPGVHSGYSRNPRTIASLYSFKTLVRALLWKVLHKSSSILKYSTGMGGLDLG
ncbi:MAG: glycosyltransferase family 4 protein, partial [Bacteroidia bacterium]|nr:glycosyltransferase family 4 protein [Bacteroidia bacterium]